MVKPLDLHWESSLNPNSWSVNVSNIGVGSSYYAPPVPAILSGRPYIGIPLGDIYFTLESAIIRSQKCKANLNPYGAFICESDTLLTGFPNITMTVLNKINIVITPDHYIYNTTVNGKNVYVVAIIPIKENGVIILGTPFLHRVYTVLDYDNVNIGMASIDEMQAHVAEGFATVVISMIAGVGFILIVNLICFLAIKKKKQPNTSAGEESFEVDTKT